MFISYLTILVLTLSVTHGEECVDYARKCPLWKKYCESMRPYMEMHCAATCGFCKRVTTMAVPTPPAPTFPVIPAGQCGLPKVITSKVVNGVDAKHGAWPWQVLIRFLDDPHCGGSIISPFWIVTAAHCVKDKEILMDEFKIITGEHNFNKKEGTETSIGVSKIIIHDGFNFNKLDSDIALLKTDRPIPFSKYVGTICLPGYKEEVPVGTECTITGWGKTQGHGYAHPLLQQAVLPIVKNSCCHTLNKQGTGLSVTSNMVCAGFGPSSPTGGCHGDSGGPLVCPIGGRWVLHGAVSWGSGKCETYEAYTVFARISELRPWMDQKMAEN